MRLCPYCKMEIPQDASICGHCRKNVSKLGMVGDGMQSCGLIMTLLITVPALLFFVFMRGC
jgi:hypothetical protein